MSIRSFLNLHPKTHHYGQYEKKFHYHRYMFLFQLIFSPIELVVAKKPSWDYPIRNQLEEHKHAQQQNNLLINTIDSEI